MKNLEGLHIAEVPEEKIEKQSISEISYEDAENFDDCYKDNNQIEEVENFDDCYKNGNQLEKEETYDDCYKQTNNGIPFEYLVNLKNRLIDEKSKIPREVLDGKYKDENIESYNSKVSMFINLGKMYFGISEKIELENLYDLIDEERKQKNK